jgi:hypothetical protein
MDKVVRHTLLPWYATGRHVQSAAINEDNYVCKADGDSDEQEDANAAFIVLACNNHDSLLAALDATRGIVAWAKDHGADKAAVEAIEKMTRKAIRKARKGG